MKEKIKMSKCRHRIEGSFKKKCLSDTRGAIKSVLNGIRAESVKKQWVTGLSTGLCDLDYYTKGFINSELILVAGSMWTGKLQFALEIVNHVAVTAKKTVGVFSLDLSKEQIMSRLLSINLGTDCDLVDCGVKNSEEWDLVKKSAITLCKAPIYVDDTNDSTLKSIKEKCIRLKNEHDLGFVLIDYLQLIRYQDRNTESDMKIILRELKGLARELDCPVLVISEISPDKSYDGSICPDDMYDYIHFLDYVLFMTRDNMGFSAKSQNNVSVVTVVRHRDGVIGKMKYEHRGNSLPRRI